MARNRKEQLEIMHPHAAGIDVHSDAHVVCTGPGEVQSFGGFTVDLQAIATHLRQHGVTTVAMESTGVYWIPLFDLLEAEGFAVQLVEPGQLSSCGARPKTDVLDCQWIQRLHSYGLLRGSFRPPAAVRALRSYWRQRTTLVRLAANHVQRMQKALEQMNIKLPEVLSNLTGVSGTRIVEAILAGERNPQKLAALADKQCHASRATIAQALEGTWWPEHLFELKQAHGRVRFYTEQLVECDQMIEQELAKQPDRSQGQKMPKKKRAHGKRRSDLQFNATEPLFKALGVDLTAIDGIEVGTALVILAEIGVDVSRFPTEKHFGSWLGLSPQPKRSNKTAQTSAVRKGSGRVKQALRLCAQSVGRTMTPLGIFYRRIKSRIGGRGACTATAHKLARLVYRMLKFGTTYVTQGLAEYEARMQEQSKRRLEKLARKLGYQLVASVSS
jgi:transposase